MSARCSINNSSKTSPKYKDYKIEQTDSELVTRKLGSLGLRHIFQGHIAEDREGNVVAQGLHSLVEHPNNVKIIKKMSGTDINGIYQVKLAMVDFETGQVYRKNSTMFPHNWSKERIINEIESVLSTITVNPTVAFDNYFIIEQTSPSEILLKMIFYNGRLESVYPIYKRKS